MPQNFYELLWIFIIYAFIGWCTEVSYAAVNRGIFVNRGFLNGPYCPIYGCGVVIVVKRKSILFICRILFTDVNIRVYYRFCFRKSISQQMVGLQ